MIMSHPLLNPGRLVVIVDDDWRKAQLPHDTIRVPLDELPDPDSENGPQETLKELEKKWTDLGLHRVEGAPQTDTSTKHLSRQLY